MSKKIIDAVLTIKMVNDSGCTDNSDIARMNMLAMEIQKNPNIKVSELKQTMGYKSCIYNINFDDKYLQSLLDEPIVIENR